LYVYCVINIFTKIYITRKPCTDNLLFMAIELFVMYPSVCLCNVDVKLCINVTDFQFCYLQLTSDG